MRNKIVSPGWAAYLFAAVVASAAVVFRFGIYQLTGIWISLPLCGFAAIFGCLWQAGTGPALFVAALTTGWYVWDLGVATPGAWIQGALYLGEAGVLCLFSHRLRLAKDTAAQGDNWQRQFLQTAGEGVWMVNPDGVIAYANPRVAEILGCGVDRIEGRKVEDFLFPEDVPAERIRFQNRRDGSREQYDRRLRRADGSPVWTLACSSPYSSGTKQARVLTIITDITERKNAEHALRRSEQKYRELFENILEGVYQTSPDGRILAANPELLRMLGFETEAELNVAGVVKDTFVDGDLHQSLRDRLERDGSYANVEFQLCTRDRRIITVRENARVVRDENGNVLYYEGTLTDITGKLSLERQLRQTEKMRALRQLAGGIAQDLHHIGAAMENTLQRAAEALPRESPAAPGLVSLAKSMHSAEALKRQILDFSQHRSNEERKQSTSAIDINAFIADFEPALRQLLNPEGTLELSLCGEPAGVTADPGHLKQVITRFVMRARDFKACIRKIEMRTSTRPGLPAGLALTDNDTTGGPFVSLSVRGRFGLSEQLNTAGEEVETDDALWAGMAISQAILSQYGGVMTAAIEPPVAESAGDTHAVRYTLYLPQADGVLSASRATGYSASLLSDPATILLVEDDQLFRELSRDLLERQGFRVLAAGSSAEAESITQSRRSFDVLIVPWAAENGEGNALVQRLRGMRPELPVLFLAGDPDETGGETTVPTGCTILKKPFPGDVLGRTVRQLLDRSGSII